MNTQLDVPAACRRIGNYRLEREIGRGGMGVVYLATHVTLERTVALKLLRSELAQESDVVERMLQEARCAAQITGQHVVRVIDVGQLESGQPFIVMEYVEGEDLGRVLEEAGAIAVEQAVQWVMETCVAIAEAHEKGIVHRDLKPENLLLAREESGARQIKVLDFGISKQLRRTGLRAVTRPDALMGSPHYMAPEQIRAPLQVDARADLWALGAILVELIGGGPAFPGQTPAEVWAGVLQAEPYLPAECCAALPEGLLEVLRRALQKAPEARFQSVLEFVTALAPYASDAALPALAAIERRALGGKLGAATERQRSFPVEAKRATPLVASASAAPLAEPARRRRLRSAALALLAVLAALWFAARSGVRPEAAAPPETRRPTEPASLQGQAAQPLALPVAPLALPSLGLPLHEPASLEPPVSAPAVAAAHPSAVAPRLRAAGSVAGSAAGSVAGSVAARRVAHPAPNAPDEGAPTDAEGRRENPPPAPHNPWDLTTFGGRL